jgi:hypothetical protein
VSVFGAILLIPWFFQKPSGSLSAGIAGDVPLL